MKLRAQIVVDIDAADYVAAAEHQTAMEHLLTCVRAHYPGAQLTIRERRQRNAEALPACHDDRLIAINTARIARRS